MTDTGRNAVEDLIVSMHEGHMAPEEFARRLLKEQLFMPVQDEKHRIAGFQASTKATPLIVDDEDRNRVLVLFTSPDRAKAFLAHYPGYSGGLLTEFAWVVKRIAEGMGISINPGQQLGMDLDPEMVAMTLGLLGEDA
ncbi:MAG TPA: SseB family protein [Burkholderiales bacterium]|nr:SseB family protein [Burkholderiales bacterium]